MDQPPYAHPGQPQPQPEPQRWVSKTRKRTNHTFHLWMTLFTCGMWGFVWITMICWNAWGPRQKTTTRAR